MSDRQFAKSIREKAADMALGFVQPPPNRDLPNAATPKVTVDAFFTPKHTRKQRTISISNVYGTTRPIDIHMDIVLDTPVLVLPRSSCSSQVFVVHLGKISMTNNLSPDTPPPIISRESRVIDSDFKIFTIDEESASASMPIDIATNRHDTRHIFDNNATYCSEEDLSSENFDRIGHCYDDDADDSGQDVETYILDVRNINAFSLDTRSRKGFRL